MICVAKRNVMCNRSKVPAGFIAAAIVCGCLTMPSALRAGEESLPKAEKILDRYVEAIGGEAALKKLDNRLTKGTLEFVGMGVKGNTTAYAARPVKHYFVLDSPSFGKIESGTDGQVAWEISAMIGPQIKKDEERAAILREAAFDGVVNWRKLYKKAECIGVETVDDQPCHKIVMAPNEGQPETHYYDQKSGLLVKSEISLKTAMGTMPIVVQIGDYKSVDGVLFPHSVKQVIAGTQQMLFVTESIQHNVEIPVDRFKLPADIQALVEKEKNRESKKSDEG